MIPIIAIVGRPNVGKSTLFNRLAGQPLAIVHDMPGVTRDRHYADAWVDGRNVTIIDTGGFDPTSDDPMGQGIARHVLAAIDEADLVLCLLDGSMDPTSADRDTVELLRRCQKPVLYAANKVDGSKREAEAGSLFELGVGRIHFVSALHGRGMGELEVALSQALPPRDPSDVESQEPASDESDDEELPAAPRVPRVTFIGRPNAGKSSLFNLLSGSERSLVDHRPGTTRDPVDSEIEWLGRPVRLVDTAGIRRKARVEEGVEAVAVIRAIRAIDRSDVVVLMTDLTGGLAEQDARLLGLCAERGRALVVALNKTDLVDTATRRAAEQQARDALHFAPWAPIVHISAKTGAGVERLGRTVLSAADEFYKRIPTGALNRFFEEILDHHPPPTNSGRAPRIYYVTQARSAPPLFVAMSNAPDAIRESYRRYVANQIRERFGFSAVPVRVRFRGRGGDGDR